MKTKKAIFEEVRAGGLRMRNRLVRSATWLGLAAPDGALPEEVFDVYRELAEEAAPDAVVLAVTGIHGNFHSFSQVARIGTPGALLIGSFDVFAGGEPVGFLRNIAAHFPEPGHNRLVVIPGTGHTYRGKERETARAVAELVARWRRE
ncbi:MAG: hypothetical protein IKQ15_00715 [Kiritimatiellae bacterium]|nr:hypothetical protein [Kiritimatiellia bacterium]